MENIEDALFQMEKWTFHGGLKTLDLRWVTPGLEDPFPLSKNAHVNFVIEK